MSTVRPRLNVSPKMRNKLGVAHRTIANRRVSLTKRLQQHAVVKASAAKIFAAASAAAGIATDTSVQRGNIKVVVRVRPTNARESALAHKTVVVAVDEKLILFDPKDDQDAFYFHGVKQKGNRDMLKKPQKDLKFCFDHVYGPQHTNEYIFQGTIFPILETILNGFNCSVFAYGATGAGKTYTMLGSSSCPGLTFLTVMELYKRLDQMKEEYEAEVVIAYLEVYNETVRDLLNNESQGPLNVLENANGVVIPNLSMHKPQNEAHLLQMLADGNSLRSQHPTDQNAESSRSHAVFQVFITLRSKFTDTKTNLKVSKLVMVDLAGSERGAATGFQGARFKEGASINKSLLALGNCINALADGKRHIPFRDSKLTRILKDSLGGNCKTVMIANVSPSDMSYEDTYNTLRYADRAKRIRFQVKKNVMSVSACISKYGKVMEEMTEVIERLKKQLDEKEKNCRCTTSKMDAFTETEHECVKMDYEVDSSNAENIPPGDATITVLKPQNLNETFTTSTLNDTIQFQTLRNLLDKRKTVTHDLAKLNSAKKEAEKKIQWKTQRLSIIQALGSLNQASNEPRLEKMRKQIDSSKTVINLLGERIMSNEEVAGSLERQINSTKNQLEAIAKTDEAQITLSLDEYMAFQDAQEDLVNRKASENYLLKANEESMAEAFNYREIVQQCSELLQPLYKIVRHNKQLTDSMEASYNDIMASLSGSKVTWATKLKSPGDCNGHSDTTFISQGSTTFSSIAVKADAE